MKKQESSAVKQKKKKGGGGGEAERVKGMSFVAKEVRDEARPMQYFSSPL